jgi:hypothetical protein
MTTPHTTAVTSDGDDVGAVRPRGLPSFVIPAKAGIHASFHVRAISETAPTSKRVVGPGRPCEAWLRHDRRDDVGDVAPLFFFHLLNESLFS